MMVSFARVGDLAEQIRGVTYGKEDASKTPTPGYLPVLRAGNITDFGLVFDDLVYVPEAKVAARQKVRKGDIVIAASSGSLDVVGKAAPALAAFDGGFGAFCKVIRPTSKVDAAYLAQFFKTPSYRRTISSLAAGANINNLKSEHLDDLRVPLPPLPEQRRIAVILDQADALRAKRREALAQLDSLTQSIFIEMFGDPAANPRKWQIFPMSELFADSPIFGTMIPAAAESGSWLCLRVASIQDWQLDLNDKKFVDLPADVVERHGVKDGDLLMARAIATQEHLGKCIVARPGSERWAFDSHLMRLRFRADRALPDFIRQMLRTPGGRSLFLKASRKSSVQYNINTKEMATLALPIPPIAIQQTFVARIEAIESLRATHQSALAESDALFASLQHRAFAGQLE